LAGPITVSGPLTSTGTTFTSLKNAAVGTAVCGPGFDSVFSQKPSPLAPCPPPASGDWVGISVSGAAVLTNTTISFDDGLTRNVLSNDASPAIRTAGAAVTVECSSIQSGGVSGDGSLTVKENDFVPRAGVAAPNTASAENNWWGQAGGPSGQLSGGVAVTTYFTTQNPTA